MFCLLIVLLQPNLPNQPPALADPIPKGFEVILRETLNGQESVWFIGPEEVQPAPTGKPIRAALDRLLGRRVHRTFRLYVDGKFKEEIVFRSRKRI